MKIRYTILFLLISICVNAQQGVIRGRITDAINNEPLPYVNVLISGTNTGTQSDLDGYYLLENLEPGLYNLEFSFIGYKKKNVFELQVSNAVPVFLDVKMEEVVEELEAVEIKAEQNDKTEESPLSLRTIGVNEIQRNPGGNRDISRVIQSLPGVTYTPSFRNDIIIRGGAPNENRFYLDGVEVPNINHFATQGSSGGPVGLINVDFIRQVEFYSGAFPANYGNAMSSVLEFEQRNGRTDKWGGAFTLGSSDIGLTIEGPTGEKSSLLFSARRSYLQFLFKALGLPFLPTYNDFQLKEKIRINDKNEINIIGLGAIDQFALNLENDSTDFQKYILGYLPVQSQWNYATGIVYKHYREKGYSTLVASRNMLNNRAYKYIGNDESLASNLIYDYISREAENKFRYEEIMQLNQIRIKAGLNYEYAKYTTDTYRLIPAGNSIDSIDYTSLLTLHKWGIFANASRVFFSGDLTLSAGFRMDANNYSPEMKNMVDQFSPRFSLSYQFLPKWSFNANTGMYFQLPAYTVLGYRDSLGNLVNQQNHITYIECDHLVAGFEYRPKGSLKFSLEGFYKYYRNYPFSIRNGVSLANLGADFGVIGNEPVTSTSAGRSYGVELFAQQKLNKNFYGILAITYVTSEFENAEKIYEPSAWDNKTIISLTAGKKFKHDWELGAKFRFSGGLPYTPYDIYYSSLTYVWDINQQAVPDFDKINSERLKPYHQLDIRIDKKWFYAAWNLDIYLDVQNIYNYKIQLAPIIDVVKDAAGNPVIDPDDPDRYATYLLENESGTVLPSIGIVVEL